MNIKIVTELFEFKIGHRSTVLVDEDGVIRITNNELSLGECAAIIFTKSRFLGEKPEKFYALVIAVEGKEPIFSSYECGEVVVTGAKKVSDDVLSLIKAITIGIESSCDWNESVDFGMVEIEGAKMCKKGEPIQSDPYRNIDLDKSEKWVSGWKAAKSMLPD